MKRLSMLKYGTILLMLLTLFVSAGHANTFTDDFSTGINSFYWTPTVPNPATNQSTVVWDSANQRVLMTQGATSNAIDGVSLLFNYKAQGNFEVRVDYQLITWNIPGNPYYPYNHERLGLGTNFGAVERISDERYSGERYTTDYNQSGGGITTTGTTDDHGTLRFVRGGGVLSGYYLSGATWVLIATDPGTWSADTNIAFAIWPWNPVPGVQVAFDNFYLTSDAVIPTQGVPEPTTMLLLGFGLVGLAAVRRIRK